MEKLIVILGLGLTIGMFNVNSADAQPASVHININLDRQPAWGPAGYDYAEFYYFPALNIYFDVNEALFYYLSGRRWVAGYYLPVAYRKYDLYYMYKVVLNDYPNPWVYNKTHKRTYVRFSNVRSQTPIRYATEHRYGKAKNNTRAWIDPRHENNRSDNRQLSNPADNRRNESQGRSSKPEVKKEQPSNRSSNSKPEVKKEQPSNRSSNSSSATKKSSRSKNSDSTTTRSKEKQR